MRSATCQSAPSAARRRASPDTSCSSSAPSRTRSFTRQPRPRRRLSLASRVPALSDVVADARLPCTITGRPVAGSSTGAPKPSAPPAAPVAMLPLRPDVRPNGEVSTPLPCVPTVSRAERTLASSVRPLVASQRRPRPALDRSPPPVLRSSLCSASANTLSPGVTATAPCAYSSARPPVNGDDGLLNRGDDRPQATRASVRSAWCASSTRAARPRTSPEALARPGVTTWLAGLVLTVLVDCATSATTVVPAAMRQVALALSSS